MLGALLGLDADEPVRVAVEERAGWVLPESEEACAEQAVAGSKELRRLQSALTAKGFELNAEKAAKLPRVDLVAQYSLLGRYNNYEDFFSKFQRHNGQFGVAVQIPLFSGPGVEARTAQAAAEVARLRLQLQAARNRVANEARRLYQQVKQAESARDVARLDLEVAREQLSVLLAQMDEGRASFREVEQARMAEDEKWMAFLEANYALEAARLDLLKQTGDLLAALR
jgi:outer membrane protein TolC